MPPIDPELIEISTVTPDPQPQTDVLPGESDLATDSGPFLTEKSDFKATPSQHKAQAKKGVGGRPRKDDLPQGSLERAPTPLPRPPCATYKNDATNGSQRSKAFYTWWNGLPSWAKSRTLMYVYRTWPVFKVKKEEVEGVKEFSYIDKIDGSEPIQDDMDLLQKYGCGSYKLLFNESPGQTIATIWITNLGGDRLLDNPPIDRRISNPEENLDMAHPANKSYIEFLRMRGKLPEQQIKEKAEAEMATIQAMEQMASTNKELMHEVISMAKDKSAPANDSVSVMASAATKGQEILQSAVTQAMGMIAAKEQAKDTTLDTALMIVDRITAAGKAVAVDPVAATAAVSPYIEEIRELRREVADLNQKRLEALEKRLEDTTKAAANPASTPTSQFASIKEGITAFKEMKGLVDEVSGRSGGGDEGEDNPGGPAWLKTVAAIAPHASSIFGTVRDMFGTYMMVQRGMAMMPGQQQGQGQQPGQAGQPGQPVHPGQPQPHSQPAQPAMTQPHPGPQLVQPPQPIADPAYGLHPQVAELLSSIKISFLNHLESSVSDPAGDPEFEVFRQYGHGGVFADWFVGGFGSEYFANVGTFGEEMLLQAIYAYPPIASNIPKTGASVDQTRKFVQEFLAYKVEDGDGEDGGNGGGADSPHSTPNTNGGAA